MGGLYYSPPKTKITEMAKSLNRNSDTLLNKHGGKGIGHVLQDISSLEFARFDEVGFQGG